MTQYDAGPGDWSERPWDDPERKPKPQAKRRRVTLPPWALLAILVSIIILLCVSLVLVVRALRGGGDDETPTPAPTLTSPPPPTVNLPTVAPTLSISPTATVDLQLNTPEPTPLITEIGPGALVLVQGTLGAGLNLREEPTTAGRVLGNAREGTTLLILEGPTEADGYIWWKLRTPDGQEGWGANTWLSLKTE